MSTHLYVTHHALERFQERYDIEANEADLRRAFNMATLLNNELAASVTRMAKREHSPSEYFWWKTGIFVVEPPGVPTVGENTRKTIVTFLGLTNGQMAVLRGGSGSHTECSNDEVIYRAPDVTARSHHKWRVRMFRELVAPTSRTGPLNVNGIQGHDYAKLIKLVKARDVPYTRISAQEVHIDPAGLALSLTWKDGGMYMTYAKNNKNPQTPVDHANARIHKLMGTNAAVQWDSTPPSVRDDFARGIVGSPPVKVTGHDGLELHWEQAGIRIYWFRHRLHVSPLRRAA